MPTIQWVEVCGFRAFTKPQRLNFTGPLALISGPNSHGKTSVAEAIEFLLCGETLRRSLLGGAKAEFEGTLRNAHLDDDALVWIKAGILAPDGITHEVERKLIRDYPADGVCQSELLIDGAAAGDLSSLGIVLSDPPLRTPILFQHTVRFALSAAPKERAEYFRAILEVADLEVIRERVVALCESLRPPADLSLQRLDRAASLTALEPVSDAIRGAVDQAALVTALEEGLQLAATELQIAELKPDASLSEQAKLLVDAIKAHSERAFPTGQFQGSAPPSFEAPALDQLTEYAKAATEVDHEIERLRRLFEATLELPHLADVHNPVDCPVCETPEALTPQRLQAMREELTEASNFRAIQTAALSELDTLVSELDRVDATLSRVRPAAATLAEEDFEGREQQASDLVENGGSRVADLRDPLRSLATGTDACEAASRSLRDALVELRAEIVAAKEGDLNPARGALGSLALETADLKTAYAMYLELISPLLGEIRDAAIEHQQVGAWADFAELANDPDALAKALQAQRVHQQVSEQLEQASRDIEHGIGKVVDAKFEAMSDEIATWWKLLRPEEPVEFNRVGRRGTGRRYVLFKAMLRPSVGAEGVERDALGVFSDSQLNALGLAAFLARSAKQKSPFILLDDPVQAGDEDHRATFNAGVLEELIARNIQVIVVSHDEMLSKLMHSRYEHLPINGFAITMESPGDGACVVATSDTAEALLQRAGATLKNENPEIRRANTAKLREAAERLAKEILVKKRTAAGETVTIADYNGQTLGPLIADLEPHLDHASHKGKWKNVNQQLSRGGSHDTEVPTVNDLGVAFGDLKAFRRDYLKAGQ